MKRLLGHILLALGLCASAMSASAQDEKIVFVGHWPPSDPFFIVVKNGAEEAAEDLGVELSFSNPATGDLAEQARLIEQAVAAGPQVFTPEEIAEARGSVMEYSDRDDNKVTHFHGHHEDRIHLQRRVWKLLNKGDIFVAMVQSEPIVAIMRAFLGDEFILGSIAANRLLPGGPGQELHVDYPYWDLYKRSSFPTRINASFPLNAQATSLLDDFTEENGATAIVPGSQRPARYPEHPARCCRPRPSA